MKDALIDPFFKFLSYEHAALLTGIVWGQKNMLLPEQYEMFKNIGLLHLLVLSGQNITLLSEFVAVILRALYSKKIYVFMSQIAVAIFYMCLFSNESPIVRAGIMAIILTISKMYERNTRGIFILLITAAIMLIFNSPWFYDVSFWLSVSSTTGILVIHPYLNKKNKNPLFESFSLAASAQIATLPIALLVFRELPLLAVPMNIAVSWLIEPIMVFGVLLSFFGVFIPPVAIIFAPILNGMLLLLIKIVEIGNSFSSNLHVVF